MSKWKNGVRKMKMENGENGKMGSATFLVLTGSDTIFVDTIKELRIAD